MTNTELTLTNLLLASNSGEDHVEILEIFDRENDSLISGDTYGEGWSISEMLEVLSPYRPSSRPTLGGVEIEEVKQWGGEGEGDSIGYVFKHGDAYVEVNGYYTSYEGANWEDASITEVEPREVTVTKFFPKDSK